MTNFALPDDKGGVSGGRKAGASQSKSKARWRFAPPSEEAALLERMFYRTRYGTRGAGPPLAVVHGRGRASPLFTAASRWAASRSLWTELSPRTQPSGESGQWLSTWYALASTRNYKPLAQRTAECDGMTQCACIRRMATVDRIGSAGASTSQFYILSNRCAFCLRPNRTASVSESRKRTINARHPG